MDLQKMNNEVQMFKIKSIGTLVEYLDKYKMDLLQIKSIAKKFSANIMVR